MVLDAVSITLTVLGYVAWTAIGYRAGRRRGIEQGRREGMALLRLVVAPPDPEQHDHVNAQRERARVGMQ